MFAAEYGVKWLPSEFKKRGRELRSQQLCAAYGIYRQNYCGCEFSARMEEKPAEHPVAETEKKETIEVQP